MDVLDILFNDCILPDGDLDTDHMVTVLSEQPRLAAQRRAWVKALTVWIRPHIQVYTGETRHDGARGAAIELVACALLRQDAKAAGF